jgi:hypothetical protein
MAALIFTIADGIVTISGGARTTEYSNTDLVAKTWSNGLWDGIQIFRIFGGDPTKSKVLYETTRYQSFALVIGGVSIAPTSAASFVQYFNKNTGTSLGFNTQYPQNVLGTSLTLAATTITQITAISKSGAVTLTTPSGNAGTVYVGGAAVSAASYPLVADKSVYLEIDNLSKIYVFASNANDKVGILASYKN